MAICSILTEGQVDHAVVGGLAAVILGSPRLTEDIDDVPSRDRENLERLSHASGLTPRFAPRATRYPRDRQWEEHASSEEIAERLVIWVASLNDIIES